MAIHGNRVDTQRRRGNEQDGNAVAVHRTSAVPERRGTDRRSSAPSGDADGDVVPPGVRHGGGGGGGSEPREDGGTDRGTGGGVGVLQPRTCTGGRHPYRWPEPGHRALRCERCGFGLEYGSGWTHPIARSIAQLQTAGSPGRFLADLNAARDGMTPRARAFVDAGTRSRELYFDQHGHYPDERAAKRPGPTADHLDHPKRAGPDRGRRIGGRDQHRGARPRGARLAGLTLARARCKLSLRKRLSD